MKFHRAWMPLSLLTLAGCSSIPWVETDRPNCVADVFFPVKYERVMWSGQCSNGKVNGQGTLVSSSGTRLEGTFHDGIVQNAQGRVFVPRLDGQRVLVGATFKDGRGDFYHLKKEPAEFQAYARRLAETYRKQIIFAENPVPSSVAVIEVTSEPNGRVKSFRLQEPSSSASWDAAVMKAVSMVDYLPSDADGIVPPRLVLVFRTD